MSVLLRHILLLFVLAGVCYVIAGVAGSRLGFIVFFAAGVVAELVFWILFWRERRQDRRADTPAA